MIQFDEKGFNFKNKFISWDIVELISTYKIDLIAYDEIILELETSQFRYSFPESEENWMEFAQYITDKFALEDFGIWYEKVMKPAFKENRRILMNRKNLLTSSESKITPMNQKLWNQIQAFDFDQPQADYSFSIRLADENFWTEEFTQQATLEYKKFMYLAVISDQMVSPSEIIDKV